jgi:hypothetical protein
MELFVLVLAAALTTWLVFRMVRRAKKKADIRSPSRELAAFEDWILAELERELGKKLTVGREMLGKTLHGNPEPEAVSAVEEAVAKVEVEFARMAHETDAELVLSVSFEDGTRSYSRKRVPLNELPESVRTDFDRTGSARVFRTWDFPWSRPR